MPSPFRISSKAFFITYPQCPILPKSIVEFCATKGSITYAIGVQELHEDGNPHLHVLVIYADKLTVRTPTFFDHEEHHPNVQSARDRKAVQDYIKKSNPEGDKLYETGTFDAGTRGSATRAAWEAAINAKTAGEVMAAVQLASPRDFVTQYDKILAYAQTKTSTAKVYTPPPEQTFTIPALLDEYLTLEFPKRVSYLPLNSRATAVTGALIARTSCSASCLFLVS